MVQLLTDIELEAWGIGTRATLQKWRQSGLGPPFIMINGSVRYVPEVVERWLAERPQYSSTREYTGSRSKSRNIKKSESESEDEKAPAA